ncbi:unnamed protein product [Amoebophrya sp. A25]|nr:unnamed protein product [Amoebophrya sp. A25]|eukprot:GSA25T00006686001.1
MQRALADSCANKYLSRHRDDFDEIGNNICRVTGSAMASLNNYFRV